MSVKITKSGLGKETSENLLFEFLPHELPDHIAIKFTTSLGKSRFIGSLQNNQIQGAYLEPISFSGMFFGTYVASDGNIINAKERSDELAKLQGRVIKFYYENFKTIAIIESLELKIYDYGKVEYSITFQPHDVQQKVVPKGSKTFEQNSAFNANQVLPTDGTNKGMTDGFKEMEKNLEETQQMIINSTKTADTFKEGGSNFLPNGKVPKNPITNVQKKNVISAKGKLTQEKLEEEKKKLVENAYSPKTLLKPLYILNDKFIDKVNNIFGFDLLDHD